MENGEIEVNIPDAEISFNLKPEKLVSGVRDFLISEMKQNGYLGAWDGLSEDQQKSAIYRATESSEELIKQIVNIVAAGDFSVIHSALDNFKVKEGFVTVTTKGRADDGALLALNHSDGKIIKMIVIDEDQFDTKRDKQDADPDQPDMLDGQPQKEVTLSDQVMLDDDDDLHGGEEDNVNEEPEVLQAEEVKEEDEKTVEAEQEQKTAEEPVTVDEPKKKRGRPKKIELVKDIPDPKKADPIEEIDPAADEREGDPKELGRLARLQDKGPDDNPFEGGTPEFLKWKSGWTKIDSDIYELVQKGYDAGFEEKPKSECPWKAGSDEFTYWMKGYDDAIKDNAT